MTEDTATVALSPGAMFWRQMRRSPVAVAGGVLLVLLYGAALLAPFLAPYSENEQDRERFAHPPMPVHWLDHAGGFHVHAFVHPTRLVDSSREIYEPDRSRSVPLRWWVNGFHYRWLGLVSSDLHLFGAPPGERVFLFGADSFGRDVFSRLLFGAQISLTVGLLGILISFSIGWVLGGIAGYLGGWVDSLIMRSTELLLSVPALYLIVALRGVFPLSLPSQQTYLAIVGILSFIGWAGFARVIRGMVLSIRRAEYVTAAEALGMSRWRIIVRHILPNTTTFVIVAASLAVPGYILGEVFLSFIGVGVQDPASSWGNMLNQARGVTTLESYPWMLFAPGIAIFITVMAFNFLGDGLRDALDPRRTPGGRS